MDLSFDQLSICLSTFVKIECEGRDPSHGFEHMEKVAQRSVEIYKRLDINDEEVQQLVLTVAWLHDVADHKYDKDGSLKRKVYEFLSYIWYDKAKFVIDIIDRISFSKENRVLMQGGKLDWMEVLGEKGCLVRDIVSDADKMEALGKIGLERMIEYAKNKHMEEHGTEIPHDTLKHHVGEHSKEKLLRLKDEFIRTEAGKEMAVHHHDEFVEALNGFLE